MIPRTIHRIWVGGEEPEWTKEFAGTWELPGWSLNQWGEEEIRAEFPLHNQNAYDHAEDIAPFHTGQLRSDILRYEILYRHGGVYVDHDLECLRPIDTLVEGLKCFAAWEQQDKWIANGFLGATAGDPFIGRLIRGIDSRVDYSRRVKGMRPNRITGPVYLTHSWRNFVNDMVILNQSEIYPYGWRDIEEF